MYGQNITPRLRKAATKKSAVIANGQPSRFLPRADEDPHQREHADRREHETPGPRLQVASRERRCSRT